jgi:hypothetical protein
MPPAIASFRPFIVASVLAEIAAWLLTLLAFGALILVVAVIKNPNIVSKGQDPAGKGMAAGCTVFLAFIAATVFGVIATIVAFNADPPASLAARIAAPMPLGIVAGVLLVGIIAMQLAKARRIDAEWAERMKIPLFVLVDGSDERLTNMYNALRTLDPAMEMRLYSNAMAYWWQKEDHFPRVRLMCLAAEGMETVHEVERTSLVAALEQWKPTTCPILLHARTAEAIDKVRPRLTAAGWTVRAVVSELEPAANADWLAAATELVANRVEQPVT